MSNAKPYMTTDDLIASIKRRISFPLSQNTFQYSDIVAFLNEEMQLSAVPSVKMEHEEYFVYKHTVELVNGVSRYEIPSRAIGMAVRDIKYSDSSGNFYDMTRIAPDDKAFFQQSNGSNQTISKYYLEGNEIVLTPLVQSGVSGKLNFFIFLRPNSLVRNDRAAIIQHYEKNITISNNSNLEFGDTVTLNTGLNTSNPIGYTFKAISNIKQVVSTVSTSGLITLALPHGFNIGSNVNVTLYNVAGITPDINGTKYLATVSGTNTLQLPASVSITIAGTGGNVIYDNQFLIDSTAGKTAVSLKTAINSLSIPNVTGIVTSTNNIPNNFVNVTYYEISNTFSSEKVKNAVNSSGITIDNENITISFNKDLSSTYTDPETMQTTDFYEVGAYVDFLQTNPGHRTYIYDVPVVNISGSVASFPVAKLQTYLNNSSGGTLAFYNIKIGDYICLANECIIPQIPPELHNALAERAASRILMAIGDVQGYQVSQAKLAEMNKYQETLIGSRVEGSVPKVFNRYSLLRLGKSRFRRRY